MTAMTAAKAERIKARGTTKARVLDHLAQAREAVGSCSALASRVGLDRSTLGNFTSGFSPVSERLLTGLYGESGCVLRHELLVAVAPLAAPATTRQVPLAEAAREAARVTGDAEVSCDADPLVRFDHDQAVADADQTPPDDDGDQRPAAENDGVDADPPTAIVFSNVGDELAARAVGGGNSAASSGTLLGPPTAVDESAIEPSSEAFDMMPHAAAPVAAVLGALDRARMRIVVSAQRARAEIDVDAALRREAIDAKALTDLAALDRTAALLAEVA